MRAESDESFSALQPVTKVLGQLGERLAAQYLERRGFRLVAANVVVPVGRNRLDAIVNAEVDLIAYDGETLAFVEVKTRSSEFAAPETAVDLRKQRQIIRAARAYRQIFRLNRAMFRYDVVAIVLLANRKPRIEFFKRFFTESKFQKRAWIDSGFAD